LSSDAIKIHPFFIEEHEGLSCPDGKGPKPETIERIVLNRPLKNGNLLRQRKNSDRLSAEYTARPEFFRFLAYHHF